MTEEYKTTGTSRTYIVENVHKTISPELNHRYCAYAQDKDGFSDRSDRTLGFGSTIGELIIYVGLHYPGSRCVAIWPPLDNDGSELTAQVLDSIGLTVAPAD